MNILAGRYKNREEIGNFNCLAVKKQGRNKNKEKGGQEIWNLRENIDAWQEMHENKLH